MALGVFACHFHFYSVFNTLNSDYLLTIIAILHFSE